MHSPPYSTVIIYGILPTRLLIEAPLLKHIKKEVDSNLYMLVLNKDKYIIRVLNTDEKIGFVILKGDL